MVKRPTKKISKKTIDLRSRLWPELQEAELWSRSVYAGFTTIPRTMPIIMNIIDQLSDGSKVYRTRFLGHKFVSCGGPE